MSEQEKELKNKQRIVIFRKAREAAAMFITTAALGIGGSLSMTGCVKEVVGPDGTTVTVTVDDPSSGTVSITPSTQEPDTTTPVEPEKTEPEVVEPETQEIDEYTQVPEELLDENGVYIPVDVTADMLRDRFAEVDNFVLENGYQVAYATVVETEILQANYAFISDEDFSTIINEYDINLDKTPEQFYYDDYEIAPEDYFFDPYLRYEAKTIYDLARERQQVWIDGGEVESAEVNSKMNLLKNKYSKLLENGEYDINGDTGFVPFSFSQTGVKLGSKYDKEPSYALQVIGGKNNYTNNGFFEMLDFYKELQNTKSK